MCIGFPLVVYVVVIETLLMGDIRNDQIFILPDFIGTILLTMCMMSQ
jgi:hypothetical protein